MVYSFRPQYIQCVFSGRDVWCLALVMLKGGGGGGGGGGGDGDGDGGDGGKI